MVKRDAMGWMKEEYDDIVKKGFDWRPPILEGPSAPRCMVDGKQMIMFCSNNYLNLSNHPKLIEAAVKAARSHGAGSGSVRPIAGNMDLHMELEKKIAAFKHREASLYYQTGFAANAGLIPQLVGKGDVLITDELNHGSIIDGVRLTKAERRIYPHNDMGALEDALKLADRDGAKKILVISDGVFSMDGDMCYLDQICHLAREVGAMTYVDDSHGEGVVGPQGRGIGAHYGVEKLVDMEMGTFSKAFGVVGGLVAGSNDMRNFALNKSRTWLLSGSAPPATAAACIAALEVLENEHQHVENLWANTDYFRKQVESMGFDTGDSVTPIVPVMCGESHQAKALSRYMYENNVFALPIVFPMVARDKARIRCMNNAGHTREDLDEALRAFESGGKQLGII